MLVGLVYEALEIIRGSTIGKLSICQKRFIEAQKYIITIFESHETSLVKVIETKMVLPLDLNPFPRTVTWYGMD